MQFRMTLAGLALFAIAGVVSAQGGFGGGGFGGGGLGGSTGSVDDNSDVVTHDHILTPGDRGEWPLKVKEGETVIVEAASTVFDAALEIVDDKETKLAENDDRRPGVQNPQLVFRFPRAGDFKILVKGYKSVAGGAYKISIRRFIPIEFGAEGKLEGTATRNKPIWFRLPMRKGQIALFSSSLSSSPAAVNIMGPDGENIEVRGPNWVGSYDAYRVILDAKRDGDYFARVISANLNDLPYIARFRTANSGSIQIDGPAASSRLDQDSFDIFTFSGKKGELIELAANVGAEDVQMVLQLVDGQLDEEERSRLPEKGWASIDNSGKKSHRFYALLSADGQYRLSLVGEHRSRSIPYSVTVRRPDRVVATTNIASELPMGDTHFWKVEGKQGQVLDLRGASDDFDMAFCLYDADGRQFTMADDSGESFNPAARYLLEKSATYYVQVFSLGNGGRGKYNLSAKLSAPESLAMGREVAGAVDSNSPVAYTFEGNKGQTIAIVLSSDEDTVSTEVIGPEQKELASVRVGTFKDRVITLRIEESGPHTLWISGRWRSVNFRLRLVYIPG
ncbi:MAG TPA: hypothetical protein PLX06_04570 [Fimbriimonadaceae bacterium]|nr:hypothetical protein [Fimbriimonadaceae bacterium]